MAILVRKINKAKWFKNDIVNGESVSADAIKNCLKTSKDTLSFWCIDDEEDKSVSDVALAIVGGVEHLDTIDLVLVNRSELEDRDIDIVKTEGRTPISDLADTHVDLTNLDYWSLGCVSECIVKGISEDKVIRFPRGKLKSILLAAIESGRLNADDLTDSVRAKVL